MSTSLDPAAIGGVLGDLTALRDRRAGLMNACRSCCFDEVLVIGLVMPLRLSSGLGCLAALMMPHLSSLAALGLPPFPLPSAFPMPSAAAKISASQRGSL